MGNVINLLPDAVANQIAAGEVVQRPASAVKELLENAIDAGASEIELLLTDAGITAIEVIDNGVGMSPEDARMSLERHATSKIEKAEDLFAIHTLGFRGEALASIAAISRLSLVTRREEDEIGTAVLIEGADFKKQEGCACNKGTTIVIKNLFYNIPARRKFLKPIKTELRNCKDEFIRVAMVYPNIKFSFKHNGQALYVLQVGSLKARIVSIMGRAFEKRLVPIELESKAVSITGFIGKAEYARKSRSEQFFFVNGRFIRSPYLGHAVENGYMNIMQENYHPSFFIFLTVDPDQLDVNIHPTKTEVKFAEEKIVYAFLQSAVKQGIGKYNVAPDIDFEDDQRESMIPPSFSLPKIVPTVNVNPDYNPFEKASPNTNFSKPELTDRQKDNLENWDTFLDFQEQKQHQEQQMKISSMGAVDDHVDVEFHGQPLLFKNRYIITTVSSGVIVVDRIRANERILFDRYLTQLKEGRSNAQRLLFPQTVSLSEEDYEVIDDITPSLLKLGFEIESFGNNSVIVHTVPPELNEDTSIDILLRNMVDLHKKGALPELEMYGQIAFSLAYSVAGHSKHILSKVEAISLVDTLFSCSNPEVTPCGKQVMRVLSLEELQQFFG